MNVDMISGIEVTHSKALGKSVVTMAATSYEALEDMFYSVCCTYRKYSKLSKLRIISICIRALIFND